LWMDECYQGVQERHWVSWTSCLLPVARVLLTSLCFYHGDSSSSPFKFCWALICFWSGVLSSHPCSPIWLSLHLASAEEVLKLLIWAYMMFTATRITN
jgi:hypothetical protein